MVKNEGELYRNILTISSLKFVEALSSRNTGSKKEQCAGVAAATGPVCITYR